MASASRFVIIPATVATTISNSLETLSQIPYSIHFVRPPNEDGGQDDHTSAFALLKHAILSQISAGYKPDKDRIHLTPIFNALWEMARQEKLIYSNFMDAEKTLEELDNIYIHRELLSLETAQEKISSSSAVDSRRVTAAAKVTATAPPPAQTSPAKLEGDTPSQKEILEKKIKEILEKIKSTKPENRNLVLLKKFLTVWGQMIPYIGLIELEEHLSNEIEKAEKVTEALEAEAEKDVNRVLDEHYKLDDPRKEEIFHRMVQSYMMGAYRYGILPARLESLFNAFAQSVNKLPFATFKKIKNVSGRPEAGGVYVSQAMETLRNADIKDEEQVIKAMGDLLDFNRLPSGKKRDLEKECDSIIRGGKTFEKKAIYLLLTRNANPNVFLHVVARHWRMICIAFPPFKNKESIRQKFIISMLERWDIKGKEEQEKCTKDIENIIDRSSKSPPSPRTLKKLDDAKVLSPPLARPTSVVRLSGLLALPVIPSAPPTSAAKGGNGGTTSLASANPLSSTPPSLGASGSGAAAVVKSPALPPRPATSVREIADKFGGSISSSSLASNPLSSTPPSSSVGGSGVAAKAAVAVPNSTQTPAKLAGGGSTSSSATATKIPSPLTFASPTGAAKDGGDAARMVTRSRAAAAHPPPPPATPTPKRGHVKPDGEGDKASSHKPVGER